MLRIPNCIDSRLTDVGKIVIPTHRPRSTPQKHNFSSSGTHFCWRLGEPQGPVRPEGLCELKTFTSAGHEPTTFQLVVCALSTVLSRAPPRIQIYHSRN
jgi:hypothetical protein